MRYPNQGLIDDPFTRRKPTEAPLPTFDVRPKYGPWSRNPQLGQVVPYRPGADNRQTILKLDEWGFPAVKTVSLDLIYTPQVNQNFRVVADVQWGVGGGIQEALIDWNEGTQFSVAANSLQVTAIFGPAYTGSAHVAPADLQLAVTVADGGAVSHSAQYSVETFLGTPGTTNPYTVDTVIPSFARTVNFLTRQGTIPDFEFVFTSTAGINLASINLGQLKNFPDGVRIAPGATRLNWLPLSTYNASYITVGVGGIVLRGYFVFGLSL